MATNSREFAKTLDELIALMELDGDLSNWYKWMLNARRQIEESPSSAASQAGRLLAAVEPPDPGRPDLAEASRGATVVYFALSTQSHFTRI